MVEVQISIYNDFHETSEGCLSESPVSMATTLPTSHWIARLTHSDEGKQLITGGGAVILGPFFGMLPNDRRSLLHQFQVLSQQKPNRREGGQ